MTDEIEGTADEIGTAVALPEQPAPMNLFHTSDPVEVLEKAARVADALKNVIAQKRLFKRIGNKDHVLVEAWATCGAMLGLTAVTVWSRPMGDTTDKGHDWEARVEIRTLDGRTIGAAEAMCTRKESSWKSRDDYALRSMAQTRATSKAFRGPLGFIVTLAGYSATPAEEMPSEPGQGGFNRSAPVERDVQHVEHSDVTVQDPWVESIKDRAGQFRGELREAVEGLGGSVPENVSSWGRVLATLDAAQRRAFESWLTGREEAKAGVPWAGAITEIDTGAAAIPGQTELEVKP